MTAERKFNTRLDQQISSWVQKQEKVLADEAKLELRPVMMEVVLNSKNRAD